MSALFADGRYVDALLALVALEAAGLAALRFWRGQGPQFMSAACTLVAGAFLLLALRAALDGAAPEAIALALLGAGIAHACDLGLRWSPANPQAARPLPATLTLKTRAPDKRATRDTSANEVSDV